MLPLITLLRCPTVRGCQSVPEFPLRKLVKQKKGYIYQEKEPENENKYVSRAIEEYILLSKCQDYIRELSAMPSCVSAHGKVTTCTCMHCPPCMHCLRDQEDAVLDTIVQALLNYSSLAPKSQAMYQIDRVQYAQALSDPNWNTKNGVQKNYVLPVAISDSVSNFCNTALGSLREVFQYHICIWAWCSLHNVGRC